MNWQPAQDQRRGRFHRSRDGHFTLPSYFTLTRRPRRLVTASSRCARMAATSRIVLNDPVMRERPTIHKRRAPAAPFLTEAVLTS